MGNTSASETFTGSLNTRTALLGSSRSSSSRRLGGWRSSVVSTAAVVSLMGSGVAVTAAPASSAPALTPSNSVPAPSPSTMGSSGAGSSQVLGSVADITPRSAVKLGKPMREPAPYPTTPIDSGLQIGALPASTGQPMNVAPLDSRVGLSGASKQFRFSYSTTNQHGQVAASTAALFLPKGTMPSGGWPVLAWAHGTVGLGDNCTPSMNPRSERDATYLNHWLNQGYAVVASDYAGQGTEGPMSYLNGKSTAANVVDSVIAARKLAPVQGHSATRWAVIGQSQGGGAALHVAQRATKASQAAGIDFRGTVATGAPAYIENIVLAGGPTFPPVVLPTGLNVYALYIMAALGDARPDLNMDAILTPEGKKMVKWAETACYAQMADAVEGTNVARAFKKPVRSIPGIQRALTEHMATATTGYDKPVFVGHGLRDKDVPTPIGLALNSEMWLNQFLASPRNKRVVVRWYPTDHGETVYASMKDSTPFLAGILRP